MLVCSVERLPFTFLGGRVRFNLRSRGQDAFLEPISISHAHYIRMEPEQGLIVHVKTQQDPSSFDIPAGVSMTVERLKEVVSQHLEIREDQSVRLLHAGRLLSDGTALVSSLTQADVHRIVVHAAVGLRKAAHVAISLPPVPRGLSRLREAGFADEEIQEVREQFRLIHGSDDEDAEERWMQEASGHANTDAAQQDTGELHPDALYLEHLLAGLSAGFVFPPVLLFGRELNLSSKYGRAGLVVGAAVNIVVWSLYSIFG